MKKSCLILMFIISVIACKKSENSSTTPAKTTPTKTYAVLYKFISTSSASDFEITYTDQNGQKTLTNMSSGWVLTSTVNAGSYVALSALAHSANASAKVQIYYDNTLLDEKYASGAGTLAYVLASGTLPN